MLCGWLELRERRRRKRGASAQAIGRTKGGRNTKVHALSEIRIRVCDVVRKGGRLLDPMAPKERERTDLTADTGVTSYKTILAEAGLTERTAQRWRAAGKLDDKKYAAWCKDI